MKVLDLRCSNQHRFEGWFGSADDFQAQLERRLVTCPVCNDASVSRLPSAPRLSRARSDEGLSTTPSAERAAETPDPRGRPPSTGGPPPSSGDEPAGSTTIAHARAAWRDAVHRMVRDSEDVGDRFAKEARRIHHGDAPARSIRGQATPQEAESLRDEGIEVVRMALPEPSEGSLH